MGCGDCKGSGKILIHTPTGRECAWWSEWRTAFKHPKDFKPVSCRHTRDGTWGDKKARAALLAELAESRRGSGLTLFEGFDSRNCGWSR